MHVVITGGAGFLGGELARRLLDGGAGDDLGVERLTVVDLVAPAEDIADDPRVEVRTGDLTAVVDGLGPADVVVHLAAVVSSAAEADFDLGMAVNVDATRQLLDRCRAWPAPPVFVLASSVAVFGRQAPDAPAITETTMPLPESSYGTEKLIAEQLVGEYSRRGFVRGRVLRLMTVAVRPGRPNAAASSFVSGIVREPLAGQPATCPVPPDTPLAIGSPRMTVDGLVAALVCDDERWAGRRALNLPAVTTTPAEMVATMDRLAGGEPSRLITWEPDPAVAAIVASWPGRFDDTAARTLGLSADGGIDALIAEHLDRLGPRAH
ncbi:MAG: D-erythronate dehydrogenase [Actinomycetota bacterium]|nr:D-erythronate dehydrogenase [Actinomycetota bacterium]